MEPGGRHWLAVQKWTAELDGNAEDAARFEAEIEKRQATLNSQMAAMRAANSKGAPETSLSPSERHRRAFRSRRFGPLPDPRLRAGGLHVTTCVITLIATIPSAPIRPHATIFHANGRGIIKLPPQL